MNILFRNSKSSIHVGFNYICGKRFLRKSPFANIPPPSFEKRLDIVILGSYNVGKSVLLNALVDTKVAATSRKRHTTRSEIVGVFNHRNIQLVFYDTPGYLRNHNTLKEDTRELRDIAELSAHKADVILLVVDSTLPINDPYMDAFADMARIALANAKLEIILVLNKVDLVSYKPDLLDTTYKLVSLINGVKLGKEKAHLAQFDTTTFMISALKDDGVIDLKNYLLAISQPKSWKLKKKEGVTTLSEKQRIEQVILESLLDNVHDELPYLCTIKCQNIQKLSYKWTLDVDIIVESSRHKKILLGYKGRTLVKLRQQSVDLLQKIYPDITIILFLWIKLDGETDVKLPNSKEGNVSKIQYENRMELDS